MLGDDAHLQIILAPPDSINRNASECLSLPSMDASRLHDLCRDARVVRVPACAPPDRDKLESWSAVWPVSLRKRPAEPRVHDACEKVRMESCIQLALDCYEATAPRVDDLSCPFSGAVLVDPDANAVLAVAEPESARSSCPRDYDCNSAARFPLQHASMRLIADLASQGVHRQ